MVNCTAIILRVGKILSLFTKNSKPKHKNDGDSEKHKHKDENKKQDSAEHINQHNEEHTKDIEGN